MRSSLSFFSLIGMLLFAFVVTASCTEEPEVRKGGAIKKDIAKAETKVNDAAKAGNEDAYTKTSEELIDYLLEYYHTYPKNKYSAECLTKVHMVHSRMGNVEQSVAYADTLLDQFPKYKNRAQIIESQIQAYEMEIKPRNVEKIKKYLRMWLAENKKAPKQKIEDMEYHLKFAAMSLEERMMMNLEELD